MTLPSLNTGQARQPTTPESPPQLGKHPFDSSTLAICGLSLRLPSGIHSPQSFWSLLSTGGDAVGPIPSSRYSISGFDTSLGHRHGIKARQGYFLSEELPALDSSFFSMTRSEVEACDPQLRKLLEVVRECLDDAGETETSYRAQNVGCYVGTFGDDWYLIGTKQGQDGEGYRTIGGDMMLANRVSYEYDFKGPSMVIKTGCSASLVALHEACRAISAGDAKSAIVAGTSVIMTPTTTESFTSGGVLSPDGSCKTFDATANGFVRAEAINAIYVKPLSAALRDGNPVRAIIRGTGTNSDGKSNGLLQPNGQAQEMLIRKVYGECGLDPNETAYVECHGTGTPTGDPIEANAVGNVFGQRGVYIGSVKPNVGHSEGASGLNSLIKCVLALENKTIPPNIKFGTPNPKIQFEKNKLRVPTQLTPFPADRKPRISINSFGIGGTNAHAIIEAFDMPPISPLSPLSPQPNPSPALLLLSANVASSLTTLQERYLSFLAQNPQLCPSDIAYTLASRRDKLPHRTYALVQDGQVVDASAPAKAPAIAPEIYLIFSGQGAQWGGMGKELLNDEFVRMDLERMDSMLKMVEHPPSWSIIDELLKPETESSINLASMSQPLCTALQIAVLNRLTHTGIKPRAVAGHSSGEIAAAYAAGAISMEAAIISAYYRGYVTTKQTLDGGMAAVGLGASEAAEFLVEGVVIACENSPHSVTISGDRLKVLEVAGKIKEAMPDVLARPLKVNMAYHSHHMAALGEEYLEHLNREFGKLDIQLDSPSTSFISSVTGYPIDCASAFSPEYWLANLVSPVRFDSAVTTLIELYGDGVFLEIGPHSTLAGPLRQICSSINRPYNYISALKRGADASRSFMACLGRLFQEGVRLDLSSFYPHGKTLPNLPRYPWDHSQSLWMESRVAQAWRFRRFAHHPLLGARVAESPDVEPQWRNDLYMDDIPWVTDHRVRTDVVFPLAAYIAAAGEAVRQMTGCEEGFSARHIVAKRAMVLMEGKGVEIVTTLRKHRITDSDESGWWEFTIMSCSGSSWTTHCEGQVRPLLSSPSPTRHVEDKDLPRPVSSGQFYQYIADSGIIFGPQFKTLDGARSSVTDQLVKANILTPDDEHCVPYMVHPTTIDACFQLIFLAEVQGLCRRFTKLKLPTLIDSIDIYRSRAEGMTVTAWSQGLPGTEGAECVSSDGTTAVRLSGFHTTPVEEPDAEFDVHAAARLEWLPDFDFADPAPLLKPAKVDRDELHMMEEMTFLCTLESQERLAGKEPCQPYFSKVRRWLDSQVDAGMAGENKLVPHAPQLMALSPAERHERVDDLYSQLMSRPKANFTRGIRRVVENCEAIFTGEAETIDVLTRDGVLKDLYSTVSFEYGDFVRLLSSSRPTLRILEVGAGTGGTTQLLLRDLIHEGGLPQYSTYTFTDISAGFFPAAKERFSYAANMEYKVFDITKDPVEQGFDASSYDLVIAANVVHATPILKESLANINRLLKPGGMLLMTEIHTMVRAITYIFGNFSGWWLGDQDGREDSPYVSPERWDHDLRAAGYDGIDTIVCDDEAPYNSYATILAKRTCPQPVLNTKVSLISASEDSLAAKAVKVSLEDNGFSVKTLKLGDEFPPNQDVIVSVDIESNFFHDISEEDFKAFQAFIKCLENQKVLWLTSPAQINCADPRSAGTIGLSRTLRSEKEVPFHTLEINPSDEQLGSLVCRVFRKIRREEDDNNLATDKEFAVSDGAICISRYHPFSLTQERCERSMAGQESTCLMLDKTKTGSLEVCWRESVLPQLKDDYVQVDVKASGVNLHDVLMIMGLIPHTPGEGNAGLEVAGVVRRVGPGVKGVNVGDRVFGMAWEGGMSTRTMVNYKTVRKIPDGMGFTEAATVPCVFATVMQGLLHVGRLGRGMSVLIHSACGGVGLAAIQVARMVGAEIFVTVGAQKKVDFLMKEFGLPRNRIFNSRNESFYDDVMRETDGQGVDVVLNSLFGNLLEKSWKCVAHFGTMVEIGKRDALGFAKLDMNPFLENRTYYCLDIREVAHHRPERFGQILDQFVNCYEMGWLKPIPQAHSFSPNDVEAAFRFLQGGSHIGKAIIDMTREAPVAATPLLAPLALDPSASYLMTGGFGGLGRSMATWMVEHGAKNLTMLSRSAGSAESTAFKKELEAMGCSVAAVAGKADQMEDVERAIRASRGPIKGVFHLAMNLQDAELTEMTWQQWTDCFNPKAGGAWNLHQALLDHPLDYFFLASSVVSMTHQIGQGNYSAANTYLEALCQYRLRQGLPASVLNISPIRGVGFVSEDAAAQRSMKLQGIPDLTEANYLDFLELCMHTSQEKQLTAGPTTTEKWANHAQMVMGLRSELDLEDPNNRTNWRRDRRMGSYHNVRTQDDNAGGDSSSQLKTFLSSLSQDIEILAQPESLALLAREVGNKVSSIMLKPEGAVDLNVSLAQMGLDSLMATELRRWFRQMFGLQVSTLDIMGSGSLMSLAETIAAGLKAKILGS